MKRKNMLKKKYVNNIGKDTKMNDKWEVEKISGCYNSGE